MLIIDIIAVVIIIIMCSIAFGLATTCIVEFVYCLITDDNISRNAQTTLIVIFSTIFAFATFWLLLLPKLLA